MRTISRPYCPASSSGAREGVDRFGGETYLGPSFHAALAALCDDDVLAERSLAAGAALLRRGSMLHNQVSYALFAGACHWRRGHLQHAIDEVHGVQRGFGAEPVGVLHACLDWMRSARAGEAVPTQEAALALERRGLGLLAISHPGRVGPSSGSRTAVTTAVPR